MKQVHWQLPFVSLKGVAYRIDIYDNTADGNGGTITNDGWPVQLVGGATPFVTDEDNDKDFFKPVRGWTGMINVVDESGNLKNEMMPKDNTDREVRLIRVSDDKVMWQGFLSCEDQSQPYTGRVGELSFNVNSMIEAMKSVPLRTEDQGFKTIRRTISDAIDVLYRYHGVSFDGFYYPMRSWKYLRKYIDNSFMYDQKSQDNENSTTYYIEGKSVYDAMEMICTIAGWCMRERGQNLYLTEKCGDGRYYADKYARFRLWHTTSIPCTETETVVEKEIGDMQFKGVDHQKEYRIGAKSVEVVARLSPFSLVAPFPKCPYENITTRLNECYLEGKAEDRWIYAELCHTPNADGDMLGYYARRVRLSTTSTVEKDITGKDVWVLAGINIADIQSVIPSMRDEMSKLLIYGGTNTPLSYAYTHSRIKPSPADPIDIDITYPICAIPCRYQVLENPNQTPASVTNAIFIQGYNTEQRWLDRVHASTFHINLPDVTEDKAIFKMKSLSNIPNSAGLLTIQSAAEFITPGIGFGGSDATIYIAMSIKVGKYYFHRAVLGEEDGYWDETFDYIAPNYENKKFEATHAVAYEYRERGIVKPANVSGELEVKIYGMMGGFPGTLKDNMPAYNALITSMDFGFEGETTSGLNDRNENRYYIPLSFNFGEEISVQSEIASNMNNRRSPSMLMENATTPMSSMEYVQADGTTIQERPERDLLQRMAKHYGKVSQCVKLVTEVGAENNTPMQKMIGYPDHPLEYDSNSESIDWKMDTSTIECETPE